MIPLHPKPSVEFKCPVCTIALEITGWHIPGMRNLADLLCEKCGREFYGDLPAGQALFTPLLLDRTTGVVHDKYGIRWFANWLRDSYATRIDSTIGFATEEFRPLSQPILLNCLDRLYGHCLLKLLNVQYYLDHRPDLSLIVLVPKFLRWMVPDGVAAIWTVDRTLQQGIEWNEWLAAEIKHRIEQLETCWLSVAFSHPHPEDFDIERFTRVRPFPIDEWDLRLRRPTVTFIWRSDRLWRAPAPNNGRWLSRIVQGYIRSLSRPEIAVEEQSRQVLEFAEALRREWPALDFAIAGLGKPGRMPEWITDLRSNEIDEDTERKWCERYALSHIVVGVVGSNMLLPSAHAGAVVELIPPGRWGNILQDILFQTQDCRESVFRCRILPLSTRPAELALIASSLLKDSNNMSITMGREFCDHNLADDIVQRQTGWQKRTSTHKTLDSPRRA